MQVEGTDRRDPENLVVDTIEGMGVQHQIDAGGPKFRGKLGLPDAVGRPYVEPHSLGHRSDVGGFTLRAGARHDGDDSIF